MAKPRIAPEALKLLLRHPFPGNVRELENILERATALCEEQMIHSDDLGIGGATDAPHLVEEALDLAEDTGLEDYLAEVEKRAILQALEETRWNRTAAAKRLGISFRALRYRLEKLGLEDQTGSD
jgi:two-component system response regulator PilR (NtrC family)